jgi:hypothetical protein
MQPNQQPFAFDPTGLLIIPGIVGPNSNFSINQNGDAVFQDVNTQTITLGGTDLQTTLNDLVTNEQNKGGSWVPLTYQNGWGDLSTTDPKLQIRKDPSGRLLYICGSMSVGTLTDGTTVANITDTTMRPANNISFPVWVHYTTAPTGFYANGLPPRFDVESNGNIRCWDINQTGGVANQVIINGTIPLDAITGSSPAPPSTFTKTYSCTGTQAFMGDGTNRGSYSSGHAYQGYYSSTNGNQFSIITFPYATIESDLSGATITKTELYLDNLFWYYNSGGTAIVGYSSITNISGNVSYSSVTPNVNSFSGWAVGASKWVTLSNTVGNAFKSGSAKSIALGQGPSTSQTYYGYFAGYGQSGAPQLRITYQK